MLGEEQNEASHAYVPPLFEDEDHSGDSDGTLPHSYTVENGNSYLPVWAQESSKSFHWAWVPLPLRKAGRTVVRWVKGPVPPHILLLVPFFPRVQELPVRYLQRFFPKRRHKVALLLLLYAAWFSPWFAVLIHSRSAGYIEGYGRPRTLSCATTLWDFGNRCGLYGNECRPFSSSTFAFRCPADCRGVMLLEPYVVGNETFSYQGLVIGGALPGSTDRPIYRADSFVCQAAIHSGTISNAAGGCGVVQLEGTVHSYPSVEQNHIQSVGFPSTFPKSFSFVPLSPSQATCPQDPRWSLLGVTMAAIVLLWLFSTSPPVLFFSTFFILFSHVGLVSDPPNLPFFADLFSSLLSRMLPASFVAYVLFTFCARPLLEPISSPEYQLSKIFLYLPMTFIGTLNNYTFAKLIPLQRLTPSDIQRQPGAKMALSFVIPIVVMIILCQAWQIRQGGLMPRYLKVYCTMGAILLILLPLPGLRLRIHHYILAILLMPGTAFPIRPSLMYQGLLLGFFINGVARWGFASIVETPASLGERSPGPNSPHGWWGATFPNVTSESISISLPGEGSSEKCRGNGNITFTLWERERMNDLGVDGVSVLVNDVERWRGYLDEDGRGEFSWHRHGHQGQELPQMPTIKSAYMGAEQWTEDTEDDDDDEPEDLFFRFAFLSGAEAGNYGGTGVWLKDGTWISPPLPKE